ncbi:hypothetical protein PENTCL1PPCAC_21227, partial [Pristionchus entomophagus]
TWNDLIISWTPSAADSFTQRLLLKETTIWRPDIAVLNSLEQTQIISEDDRLAEVLADGTVFTTNPSVYDTWCRLNVSIYNNQQYPFSINIGSWVYTANETQITTNQTEIRLDVAGTV